METEAQRAAHAKPKETEKTEKKQTKREQCQQQKRDEHRDATQP